MSSIDSGFSPINPQDVLRPEYRQVIGGNLLDKPTFGEKFKMALAKGFGFLGRIATSILPFFGPLGSLASSATYGLTKLADGAVQGMQNKKAQDMALDSQASSMMAQGPNIWAPGFTGFAGTGSADSGSNNIQVAPFARGYESDINHTLMNKGAAASEALGRI